jgi:MtrB/PioB family decaheme-associated outer membrane protein
MSQHNHSSFPLAALTLALIAAYAPALAQENEEVQQLITPDSSISVGIGNPSQNAPRFGQYSGVRDDEGYGLLDLNVVKRNDSTGTWLTFTGRNLGLDSRELRISHERQGDWAYFLDYNQTPRYEPYTVTTAVTGIGTANLTIPAVSNVGVPVQLKTQREAIGLGFSKQLGKGFNFEVSARNEKKTGSRLFARGPAFQFYPEPIDSTTRQLDATVSYSKDKLHISGAYYGTSYDNANKALTSSNAAGYGPQGLAPDNQSHQLSLAGSYSFSTSTRGTFKLARAIATQEDSFMTGVALAPAITAAGINNLGARVDTTLMQVGLTSRPTSKLSLVANLRYEDRDDKTPVLRYTSTAGATSTYDGDNEPRSIKRTNGKFEASYQLPLDLRLTGGFDYEEKVRNTSAVRAVSFREKTEEASYRLELRRSMSETVAGAISYVRSDRTGSDFQTTVRNNGTAGINLIAPVHLADRLRDKVRVSVNWTPTEKLSLQFMADDIQDNYGQRTKHELGIREGTSTNYAIDAAYEFTDAWQATAWLSSNDNSTKQAAAPGASATAGASTVVANIWGSNVSSQTNAVGFGLRGKVSSRLTIGADVSHSDIVDQYQQYAITGAPVTTLPNITTNLTSLKLHGSYAIDKRSTVRLNYVYDRYNSDDWTWSTFAYSDGTKLTENPSQVVNFVGISYVYSFN